MEITLHHQCPFCNNKVGFFSGRKTNDGIPVCSECDEFKKSSGTYPDRKHNKENNNRLRGISGLLIFPAIGLPLAIVFHIIGIVKAINMYDKIYSTYQGYFMISILADAGITMFMVYATYLFFGLSKSAPSTIIRLLFLSVVFAAVYVWSSIEIDSDLGLMAIYVLVHNMISAAIWIPYFKKSKRVAATFVQ
jgi:hypothetical protein